ncbi:M14 family zinc carboxypeptidase [Kocuria sp. MNB10]
MAQTYFETNGTVGTYQDGVDWLFAQAAEQNTVPMRVIAVGRSVQGRTIYGAIVGAEPATAEDVVLLTCSIHSGETSCRESGMQYIRQLVTTTDQTVRDYLATTSWIIIPTTQADTYGQHDKKNANGVDVNQDVLALSQPETRSIAGVVHRYRNLTLVLDSHEGGMEAGDYALSPPSVRYGVHPAVQSLSKALSDSVIAGLIANGIDAREWIAWDSIWRYRNGVATEWDRPNILFETAVTGDVAWRVGNSLKAYEQARLHHAANRTAYRDAVTASKGRELVPSYTPVTRI